VDTIDKSKRGDLDTESKEDEMDGVGEWDGRALQLKITGEIGNPADDPDKGNTKKRKAELPVEGEASFEDMLDAYKNAILKRRTLTRLTSARMITDGVTGYELLV
jgi:hypothetical protein